jgi:Peptidase propeptide and YPEB domain
MSLRRALYRIHIWLAWLIGVPLLFWTISGLWMVAQPIEEVRGEHLRAETLVLNLKKTAKLPLLFGKFGDIESIHLIQQPRGPVWIYNFHDKSVFRASADEGRWLEPVAEAEARQLAEAAYKGPAKIVGMKPFSAQQVPLDLRKARPSWQARFGDGTQVYIDANSGEVLALRTDQWRAFDWMWGLHIMDLQGREDSSHPILIGFAVLAALGTLIGLVLLPLSVRRRRL